MSLGCLNIESGIRRVRVPDAVQRATLLRRTGTHAFRPRQRWAPALQHTTPQVRRAALRPGHETSELIGLPAYGIDAVRPPSTGIACPLTWEASSLARNNPIAASPNGGSAA
jgi:hypothetical protein